jgi:hypothetical protein
MHHPALGAHRAASRNQARQDLIEYGSVAGNQEFNS